MSPYDFCVGDEVRATWGNTPSRKLYPGVVQAVNVTDGTLHIVYTNGDVDERKNPLQVFPLRPPTNSSPIPNGTRVSAEWLTSGEVFRGTVTGATVSGGETEYTIHFDDGTTATQNARAVWPLTWGSASTEFSIGQRVSAHFKEAMGVYLGRIVAVNRGVSVVSYAIRYDDGDEDDNVEPGCIMAVPIKASDHGDDTQTCCGVALCPEGNIQLLSAACGGLPTTPQMIGEMLHLGQHRGVDILSSLVFSYNFARFQGPDGCPTTSGDEDGIPVITAEHTPPCWSLYETGKIARVADDDLKHFLTVLGTADQTEQIANEMFHRNAKEDTLSVQLKAQVRRLRMIVGTVTAETAHPSDDLALCKILQIPLTYEFQKNAKEDNAAIPASPAEKQLLRHFEIEMPNKIEGDPQSCYSALRRTIVAQHLALYLLRSPALANGAVEFFLNAYAVKVPSSAELDASDKAAKEEIILKAERESLQVFEAHDGVGGVACGIVYEGTCTTHKTLLKLQKPARPTDNEGGIQREFTLQLPSSGGAFGGMNHFTSVEIPVFGGVGGIILSGTSEPKPAVTKAAAQRTRHETINLPFAPDTPHHLQVAIMKGDICRARKYQRTAEEQIKTIGAIMTASGDFQVWKDYSEKANVLGQLISTFGKEPTAVTVGETLSLLSYFLEWQGTSKEKSFRSAALDLQYALRELRYWQEQESHRQGLAWKNNFVILQEDLQHCPRR